jgi:hypothetical protein
MSLRTPLVLAGLCLLALPAGGAEPEPKLALKYQLEAELRKEGAPRTVAVETYFDKAAGKLYYATADRKGLAITEGPVPVTAADPIRPKWVRRFDLPVRGWDEKEFDKDTSKVVVEVFRDASAKQLVYVSESGAMAVLPEPAGAGKAEPRWLYRLQLRVRPAGETDFIRNYLKTNVEVYLHEPTGHLLYVGHNGALAVVPTKKPFLDPKPKGERWSHGLELKARKFDQEKFDQGTRKVGVEVFADDNAEITLYATDSLTLAAVPGGAPDPRARDIKTPVWHHQLLEGKFAAEVFANPNTGHTLVVTHAGGLAVLPGEPKPPAPAADDPAANPLKLTIALDKAEYPFRGAIALTITYENTSKDAVVLWANGSPAADGFPGETFEVTSGKRTTTYKVFAVDPQVDKVTIEPGKSWKRTIKDLAPVLSGTGIAVNGAAPGLIDPLPDPFGRLDDFSLRMSFKSEVNNQPKPAFNGTVESNTVKFKVRR